MLAGLEASYWEIGTLPMIQHRIVFNGGTQLALSGQPRLTLPPKFNHGEALGVKPSTIWPHYELQFQSASLDKVSLTP